MTEENNDIFVAGGDALVYLAEPMFGTIDLVRTYLMSDLSTRSTPSPPFLQLRTC